MTRFFACVGTREEASAAVTAGFDGVIGHVPDTDEPERDANPSEATIDGHRVLIFEDRSGRHRLRVFADSVPDHDDLAKREAGIDGVFISATGRLLDAVPVADLGRIASDAQAGGLLVALGGGLEAADVPRVLALKVDVLVFGRALRTNGAFDAGRAAAVLALRPRPAGEATHPAPGVRDRIFVRGLVRSVAIGIYASEHGRTQRVRFSIEAELAPLGHVARGMADIVSYNLIEDTVDRLVAGRHIDFVETLAEEIATTILQTARIVVVRVRVEKLDLGADAFGVEIERTRAFGPGGSASPTPA